MRNKKFEKIEKTFLNLSKAARFDCYNTANKQEGGVGNDS